MCTPEDEAFQHLMRCCFCGELCPVVKDKVDVMPADVGLDPVVLLLMASFCLFPLLSLLYIIFCGLLQKTAISQYF